MVVADALGDVVLPLPAVEDELAPVSACEVDVELDDKGTAVVVNTATHERRSGPRSKGSGQVQR